MTPAETEKVVKELERCIRVLAEMEIDLLSDRMLICQVIGLLTRTVSKARRGVFNDPDAAKLATDPSM